MLGDCVLARGHPVGSTRSAKVVLSCTLLLVRPVIRRGCWILEGLLRTQPALSVLNHGYLAGLNSHLGTAHACELLADGMIDLMGRLERLAEVAGHGDKGEIAALSHQIVGAAGHLGLSLMSQLAAQVSQAARGGDPTRWIEALLEVRHASIGELREYCAACTRDARTRHEAGLRPEVP